MLKLTVKDKCLNLPQVVEEIPFSYLVDCVKDIEVAKHRCIVAVLSTCKLSELVNANARGNAASRFVVVKRSTFTGEPNIVDLNRIIYIAPSYVFNATDIRSAANVLSRDNIIRFIEGDTALRLSITNGDVFRKASGSSAANMINNTGLILPSTGEAKVNLSTDVIRTGCFVGFKIVNETDIEGIGVQALASESYIKFEETVNNTI